VNLKGGATRKRSWCGHAFFPEKFGKNSRAGFKRPEKRPSRNLQATRKRDPEDCRETLPGLLPGGVREECSIGG
jgi:hypothetical protein